MKSFRGCLLSCRILRDDSSSSKVLCNLEVTVSQLSLHLMNDCGFLDKDMLQLDQWCLLLHPGLRAGLLEMQLLWKPSLVDPSFFGVTW